MLKLIEGIVKQAGLRYDEAFASVPVLGRPSASPHL